MKNRRKCTRIAFSAEMELSVCRSAPSRRRNVSDSARLILVKANLEEYVDQGEQLGTNGVQHFIQIEPHILQRLIRHAEVENKGLDYVMLQFIVKEI